MCKKLPKALAIHDFHAYMLFFHLQMLGWARALFNGTVLRPSDTTSMGGKAAPRTHLGQQAHHHCGQNTDVILCQVYGFSSATYPQLQFEVQKQLAFLTLLVTKSNVFWGFAHIQGILQH